VSTMLRGGQVIAFRDGRHVVLEDGCVVLAGERIAFVGFPDDPGCPPVDRTLELPGRLITAGFVNLHCIANVDLQPLRIDVGHVGFPRSRAWLEGCAELLADDELRLSARFAVAHLLRGGSTTFAGVTTMASKRFEDPAAEPQALAAAAEELGARAYLAHNFQDHARFDDDRGASRLLHDAERGQQGLRRAVRFVEALERDHGDRVRGFLFPYTSGTCSDALLRAARDAARALGVPLRSHVAQSPDEARDLIKREGLSPLERLDRLGLLGETTTLTHVIFLRGHPLVGGGAMDTELALLADSGTHVAHCPIVHARRGEALRSFDRYRRRGINIALGTDTMPADMPGEMRAASLLAKVVDEDPTAGRAEDVYWAATVGGADALGRRDLGRLCTGSCADVAVFDLRPLHLGVIDCPIKALVHMASASDTEHVFVAGRQVVESGAVVGIDEDALTDAAQRVWWRYRAALVARDPLGRGADDLYPSATRVRRP
jgi:5-methylthioadenosine/S-adenosylhomocysteine deaminase